MQEIPPTAPSTAEAQPGSSAGAAAAPPPSVDPRSTVLNAAQPSSSATQNTAAQPTSTQALATQPTPSTSTANSTSQPILAPSSNPSPAKAKQNGAPRDADGDVDQLMDDTDDDTDAGSSDRPLASTSKAVASTPARSAKRPNSASPDAVKGEPSSSSTQQPRKKHRSSAAHGQRPTGYVPPPLPHYTVVRSTHNSRTSPHVIRIHDDASDGSDSRWPAEHERRPDHKVQGRENWYECQERDMGRHKTFREKLGEELAKKLGIASQSSKQEYWIVEGLPKGHLFTVHHCVTSSNQPRLDVYIFGSPATLKFRTANEFTPHVFWLLQHGPDDTLRCECKYCSKKTQTDVNRILGLTEGRGSSVASAGAGGTPRKAAAAAPTASGSGAGGGGGGAARVARAGDPGTEKLLRPLASAQRSADGAGPARKRKKRTSGGGGGAEPEDGDEPVPAYRGSFTARQRDEDLRDVGVPRQGEVVWAKLPRALVSRVREEGTEGRVAITHWPAVVKGRAMKSRAEVRTAEEKGGEGQKGEKEEKAGEGKEEKKREDKGKGKINGDGDGGKDADGVKLKAPISLSTTQEPVFTLSLIGLDDELRGVALADTLPWLAHMPPTELMNPECIMAPESARHVWDGTKTTRDAKLADFKDAEDAATAIALACQIVAHIVASFAPGEYYLITPDYIAHKPGSTAEQNASFEQQAARVSAFQSVHFGAELLWAGDMVRLLGTDFAERLLGRDLDAGEDRAFFLRIACIYKQPETETLKFGGEVWALRDVDAPEKPALNGDIDAAAPAPASGASSSSAPAAAPAASTSSAPAPAVATPAAPPANGTAAPGRPSPSTPPPAPTPIPQLPRAPAGLKWVQISPAGSQVHLDIEFVGGRVHPLPRAMDTRERIQRARESFAPTEREQVDGEEALSLNDEQRAVVLAGLKPTVRMYMRVGTWRADRVVALIEAEKAASDEVATFFQPRSSTSASDGAASREGSA
ncbi:hypothetical protein JCM10450v2_004013 [Rhodotorula kratochvilovae]